MPIDHFHERYRSGSPYDLAQQIGESGITKLLEVVCHAYSNLCENHLIITEMSEDEITEEIFKELVYVYHESSVPRTLIPVNQKIDTTLAKNRGRPPTIDFCFRDRWVKEVFFGFECKLLAEGNGRLYQEYIDNGLCRYLQGKYCSIGSAGSMIGYIKSGNIAIVIHDVKCRVDQKKAVNAMAAAPSIGSFKEHYVSMHIRDGLSQFRVHHLFFNFAETN
jgi:hypothetical protein